jgi:hypothetical protein
VLQGKCPGLYLDCVRPPTLCISSGVGSLVARIFVMAFWFSLFDKGDNIFPGCQELLH